MLYPRAYIYFSVVLVLTVIAFMPGYFLSLGDADPAHHFHAVVAGAWMLMLISQSWAISHRRVSLHRAAGKGSYVLAPLFIASGLAILHAMQNGAGPFREMFAPGLIFVDALAVLTFAWLYYRAIANSRDMQRHARYMTATVLMLLTPVFARLLIFYVPGFAITSPEDIAGFALSFHLGNAITLLVALALLYSDRKTVGITPPYLVAALVIVAQSIGFEWIAPTGWWQATVSAFGALPPLAAGTGGLLAGVVLVLAATTGKGPAIKPKAA